MDNGKAEQDGEAATRPQQGTVQRAVTPMELHTNEKATAESVRIQYEAYLAFPNDGNAGLLGAAMRTYQSAWMNGRRRVLD
jgi:hypothetical protein